MPETLIQFVKKVTLYASALLAVIGLCSILVSGAIKLLVIPEIERVMQEERKARVEAVAAERAARIESEGRMILSISRLSTDRLALLEVMEEQPGPARRRLIREVRQEWSQRN